MIPQDFEYHKPGTIQETVKLFESLKQESKNPYYYGGGTEIISMARVSSVSPGAVIDIKGIPECNVLAFKEDELYIGAGVTLTQIAESKLFPLLGTTGSRVADHTVQGKITIGGNIAGTVIYHETLLPFLISEAQVIVAGPSGSRRLPVNEVFDEKLLIGKEELIVQFIVRKNFLDAPFVHTKKTRLERIGYPLMTIDAIQYNDQIRMAITGLCPYPFRSLEMEKVLSSKESMEAKLIGAVNTLPTAMVDDLEGSSSYREYVFKITLADTMQQLGV